MNKLEEIKRLRINPYVAINFTGHTTKNTLLELWQSKKLCKVDKTMNVYVSNMEIGKTDVTLNIWNTNKDQSKRNYMSEHVDHHVIVCSPSLDDAPKIIEMIASIISSISTELDTSDVTVLLIDTKSKRIQDKIARVTDYCGVENIRLLKYSLTNHDWDELNNIILNIAQKIISERKKLLKKQLEKLLI